MPREKATAVYLGARVPADLAHAFERVAVSEDRTVSAELRRIVRHHVEQALGQNATEAEAREAA